MIITVSNFLLIAKPCVNLKASISLANQMGI